MLAELGHFAMALAASLALFTAICALSPLIGDLQRRQQLVRSQVIGQLVFSAIAFGALVASFLADDFSIAYVATHSNSLLPWYYKFSATWGGHEGSFLLWINVMGLWMVAVALRARQYPAQFVTRVLGVLALINLGFLSFALFASNPFERLIPMTPADGADLNPLLQDFGLIVHPPMLYFGYVGLSVPFAFAIAALLDGRIDSTWARWCRPWANCAWAFLTVGIALGSWWAYYELGWGGWWFWDPSENASFMPWLAATALIHSLGVTEKRGEFKSWTVLLAIAGFSLSLLGAFIIRSGVLTSVHAFAVDPQRGMSILIFLGVVVGSSLCLFALRAGQSQTAARYTTLSREFFMLVNNVVLILSLAVVLWGTLSPIIYQLSGDHISIGPPFFNRFFVPLMLLLAGAMALVPLLNWKKTDFASIRNRMVTAFGVAAILGVLAWAVWDAGTLTMLASIVLAIWLLVAHGMDMWRRRGSWPAAYLGMTLAHVGFAVGLLGVAVTSLRSVEEDVRMAPQQDARLGSYEVRFLGTTEQRGPNYVAQQGVFIITPDADAQNPGEPFELRPEKRRYLAGGAIMTEAAIRAGFTADLYISLGEPLGTDANGQQAWAVRLHYKPLVRWIWFGALMMAAGAVLAVFDARYRRLRRRVEDKAAALRQQQMDAAADDMGSGKSGTPAGEPIG